MLSCFATFIILKTTQVPTHLSINILTGLLVSRFSGALWMVAVCFTIYIPGVAPGVGQGARAPCRGNLIICRGKNW